MTEFVKRIAAAINRASPDLEEMAKAAIQEMREPTPAMLLAFYGPDIIADLPVCGPEPKWLGNDWRDMIDAALTS